jgi:DNA-binding NarL/FixJ family response regulator
MRNPIEIRKEKEDDHGRQSLSRDSSPPSIGCLATDTFTPMVPKPYRILVADDHSVVRRGIRAMLQSQPGVEVPWEASNGIEALQCIKKEKPDLVILDLTMPEMNGLEVVRSVRDESPTTDILVLTMHFSEELAREVLACGALAYVLKSDADTDLLVAVDHVRHHQPYFTSQLAISMSQNFLHGFNPDSESLIPGTPLTAREIEVIQLLADGRSNKEVASELGVSTRTVESHRNHIMRKMNFSSFSELVRFAVRNHLVEA